MEDLIEVKELTERDLTADGNRRARYEEKERAQAVEMRDRAMERFGETRKRGKGEYGGKGEKEEKKRRRSGSDTVEFLRAMMEAKQEMKEKEREEKKEERKAEKERHDLLLHQLELQRKGQEAFQLQQQQQFQLIQQQFMGFMAQQSQMFHALLKSNAWKICNFYY